MNVYSRLTDCQKLEMAQISFNRCLNKQAMAHPYNAAAAAAAKSLQSCPNLCDPIDGSPPGRTLEWIAIPSPMHESEK